MKAKHTLTLGVVGAAMLAVSGCGALKGDPDPRWAEYKSWHKLTEGRVATGDPTNYIGNVHKGREGYRDVYVNEVGKAALTGSGPYKFPAGTVIVKEQFDDKAAWEAQKGAEVTVSLKISDEVGSAANWNWAAGYTGTAGKSDFCAGCHTIALKDDFVFTTEDFLSAQE